MGDLNIQTAAHELIEKSVSIPVDPSSKLVEVKEGSEVSITFHLRKLSSYDLEIITEQCTTIGRKVITKKDGTPGEVPDIKTNGWKLNRMRIMDSTVGIDGLSLNGKPAKQLTLEVYKMFHSSVTGLLLENVRAISGGEEPEDAENFEKSPENG